MRGALFLFLLLSFAGLGQKFSIILGRPTDKSITASVLFDQNTDYYLEYGTSSGVFATKSSIYAGASGVPEEIEIPNLTGNTRYYYRLGYKLKTASSYTNSPEYSFITQRAAGSSFTFTVEADEHLYDKKGVAHLYKICLANQLADKPDFMLSLGDTFGDDHYPTTITSTELKDLHAYYRPFLGEISHSVPFYFCLGNHEGENNYYLPLNPPNNLTAWATVWRKYYYPNPSPNSFYTGNTQVEPNGLGLPENYYAWTWGDALFVVLDAYRYQSLSGTSDKPKTWDWTLGKTQYDWLKTTLEGSKA
jgi:phosphodiesterase/alkaline phosphatase D-like protein